MTDTFIHHGRVSLQKKQCHAPLKNVYSFYFYFRGAGSLLLGVGFLCSLGYSFWQNRGSRFGASAVATHRAPIVAASGPPKEHRLRRCGVCLVAPQYGVIFQDQGQTCPMHWQADSIHCATGRPFCWVLPLKKSSLVAIRVADFYFIGR